MVSLDLPKGTIAPIDGGLDDHHLTVVFLGSDVDDDLFDEVCTYARGVASTLDGPLSGTVGGIGSFEPSDSSDGKVPAYAVPDVDGLDDLRAAFEQFNASEHTDYVPHITLGYLDEDDPLPAPVPKTPVTFTHLAVHRGDDVVRVPLGPLGADSTRALTPLARTLRRASRTAREASSDVSSVDVGETAPETRKKPVGPASESAGSYVFDIDGVIAAFPGQCGSMMAALTAAGFHVYVVSGVGGDTVTDTDVANKRQFLTSLGIGADTYHELVVIPQPHDVNKAKFIEDNHIDVLVDNSKANCKAAAPFCVSLLLWNAREK
jgi:hypothetical protein